MSTLLEDLFRLQTLENQLRSVRGRIESKRRTVTGQQRRVATLERQIADLHDLTRKAQSESDRLELERKSHESHIAKLREALNKAKTNKEYAAILTQLNTDKADASKMEDQVLTAMNRVDELKKQEAELRGSLDAERNKVRTLEQDVATLETKLAGEIKDLEAQREEAAARIPRDALSLFQRACERHEGEAMALVEQPHPKRPEFICGGCNMGIPLETVNALRVRGDLKQCNNCQRILYLEASTSVTV